MATRPAAGLPRLSRRSRILLIIGLALLILLVTGSRLLDTYVDWQWFGEVGYRSVFSTVLITRVVLFVLVGILVGGAVAVSLAVAYRSRPVFVPVSGADDPLSRYRAVITRRLRLFGIGLPVVIGLIAGFAAASGSDNWKLVQLFLHSTRFGITDPQFGNDIGFYAFVLPFVLWLQNWLFITVTIAFFGALFAQYVFGGIRFAGRGGQLSGPARMQLAILIGIFMLLKAFAYFTDRYELLYSTRSNQFTGATYTDLHALMPVKLILLCIAVFCAVAFFVGAFLRNLQLPAIALILLILSSVLIGVAWPLIMQQFSVSANANQKEALSISRAITATRQAYGISNNDINYINYDPSQANPSLTQILQDPGTVSNARLLDPNVLAPTFDQQQHGRNVFGFPPKLNIDRYAIDGVTQDYVVAAREIDSDNFDASQQSWFNQHFVYTHGDGFVAAPANQVSSGGYPNYAVSDLSNSGNGPIKVSQPRIYYGLLPNPDDYAVVGQQVAGQPAEYDTDNTRYTYQGAGGVSLASWFNRLAFAMYYSERNFLFSDYIGSHSRIIFNRNPRDRVSQVAPWLTVDGDPYPAVVTDSDGQNRIAWIADCYTTLANYPYSQQTALGNATNDSLIGTSRQPDTQIGYIRNSVKAVVDAYTGKVTLYSVDDADPVLRAWESVFPGTVMPSRSIPAALSAHFRYPEDLFKVQRDLLASYHVNNPQDFYSSKGFWSVPSDPTKNADGSTSSSPSAAANTTAPPQPPYYVLAQAPGESHPTFQLTSELTALRSQNLAAWMSVSSDPDSYGRFTVLTLPTGTQTQGPEQMQNQFDTTSKFTENRTLFNNSAVKALFGNLLTLPVAGGLLYIEPIYIQSTSASGYPQLNNVLTGFNGKVGFGSNVQTSLADLFSSGNTTGGTGIPGGPPTSSTTPSPSTTPNPPNNMDYPAMAKAVDDISKALQDIQNAQRSGNFAQLGQGYQELQNATNEFEQAKSSNPGNSSPVPQPSPTPPAGR